MSDLLQEVDEMMRQERLKRFWDENGNYVIGFIVMVILMTAGLSGYRSWDENARVEQTALALEAMRQEDFVNKAGQVAQDMRSGLTAVTYLTAAGRSIDNGQETQALDYYNAVQNVQDPGGYLQGLGTIMAARLGEVSEGSANIQALEELAADMSSPWRYHAYLELAVLSAMQENYDVAITHLNTLLTQDDGGLVLPETLIDRAIALRHVYTIKKERGETRQNG